MNICKAESEDGKSFQRIIQTDGGTGMFSNGTREVNTRDPMVLRTGGLWHCYSTAHPGNRGEDYCRTSPDLSTWSESRTVSNGGRAAGAIGSAGCPFVVEPRPGRFYLFRTFNYPITPKTLVYYSTDPLHFGRDEDDKHLLMQLPVAAPGVFQHDGRHYIAALLPDLKSIRIARLDWAPVNE